MLKKVERASMDGCKILKKTFSTIVLFSYVNLSFTPTWAMLSEEDYQKHLKNQRQVPFLNTQPIVQAPTTLPQTLADDTLKDSFTDIRLHAIKTGDQGVTLLDWNRRRQAPTPSPGGRWNLLRFSKPFKTPNT